jgi:LysM repeat protein
MKRRTRLIIIGCATLGGTLTTAAQAASATPTTQDQLRALKPAQTTTAPPAVRLTAVHQAVLTAVHQSAPAPLPTVTVQPGDSLSAIGARTGRTWVQLAGYNHISNPDLIYPGQVITVPPASYVPVGASDPAPAVTVQTSETSDTTTVSHYTAPLSGATQPSAPVTSGSGIWGCIAAHESGGNPSTNTGNGYYGMYQDTQSSWVAGGGLAYAPRADLASAAAQTAVNQQIQSQQGWGAWPVSSASCGA